MNMKKIIALRSALKSAPLITTHTLTRSGNSPLGFTFTLGDTSIPIVDHSSTDDTTLQVIEEVTYKGSPPFSYKTYREEDPDTKKSVYHLKVTHISENPPLFITVDKRAVQLRLGDSIFGVSYFSDRKRRHIDADLSSPTDTDKNLNKPYAHTLIISQPVSKKTEKVLPSPVLIITNVQKGSIADLAGLVVGHHILGLSAPDGSRCNDFFNSKAFIEFTEKHPTFIIETKAKRALTFATEPQSFSTEKPEATHDKPLIDTPKTSRLIMRLDASRDSDWGDF